LPEIFDIYQVFSIITSAQNENREQKMGNLVLTKDQEAD